MTKASKGRRKALADEMLAGIRPVSRVAARLLDEMRIRPGYWRIRLRQSLKDRKAG